MILKELIDFVVDCSGFLIIYQTQLPDDIVIRLRLVSKNPVEFPNPTNESIWTMKVIIQSFYIDV